MADALRCLPADAATRSKAVHGCRAPGRNTPADATPPAAHRAAHTHSARRTETVDAVPRSGKNHLESPRYTGAGNGSVPARLRSYPTPSHPETRLRQKRLLTMWEPASS